MTPSKPNAPFTLNPSRSWWLLSGALRDGRHDELAAMLSEGADPNARKNGASRDPALLHLACRFGQARDVQALLDAGARPDALARFPQDAPGLFFEPGHAVSAASFALDTALRVPAPASDHARQAYAECAAKMRALIDAGLSCDLPTRQGHTVWSDLLGFEQAPLEALTPWIQTGAPIDALDPYGRTLLFNAICRYSPDEALTLLELGADPFLMCGHGRMTPAEAAKCYSSTQYDQLNAAIDALAQSRALEASTPNPDSPPLRLGLSL